MSEVDLLEELKRSLARVPIRRRTEKMKANEYVRSQVAPNNPTRLVCQKCGVEVVDTDLHMSWHSSLEEKFAEKRLPEIGDSVWYHSGTYGERQALVTRVSSRGLDLRIATGMNFADLVQVPHYADAEYRGSGMWYFEDEEHVVWPEG